MIQPTLILLDEPFAGVNPTMVQTMLDLIRSLPEEGKTVFVIDHAMTIMMDLCARLLVLDMGELIADGPPAAIQADPAVLVDCLADPQNSLNDARACQFSPGPA